MGREAYHPHAVADDFNPFKSDSQYAGKWGAEIYARDWQDGWDEAAKRHEDEVSTQEVRASEELNRLRGAYQLWLDSTTEEERRAELSSLFGSV